LLCKCEALSQTRGPLKKKKKKKEKDIGYTEKEFAELIFKDECREFCFVLMILGFELRALGLLYHLGPFCFCYFSDRVSHFLLRAGFGLQSSYLHLQHSCNYRYVMYYQL
jgi:hypothetical protein